MVAGCLALVMAIPRSAVAQDESSNAFRPVSDGPGIQFRTGHIAFPTFGRDSSITHAELFPYVLDGNQMFFGNGRMFMNNYGRLGGNLGLGYRTRPWGGTNIFGASVWYDADDSLDKVYQDLGISLEHYSELFDLRLNGYVPVGNTSRQIADRLTNPEFVGTSLVYDRVQLYGTALGGVDYEVGVPLPPTVLRQHNLRVYVGAYHFGGNGVEMISGGKARLEGAIIPSVEAQLAVTSDSWFGTNVTLGVSWTYFGGFERTETNQALRYDRMGEFVNRNYNVIVGQRRDVTAGVPAVSPLTGAPYVIQHVGPGGNSSGAPDDPWGTIADAQIAGGDVILVHAGTVLTEPIVLSDGEVIIGQGSGSQDFLDVQGFGPVLLPKVGPNSDAPLIQGVTGNAVTLANNSIFAGFIIDGPSGHGIFADGVHDAVVGNTRIDNAGGDGIFLQNGSGGFSLTNVEINDAAGTGLRILGGSADMSYSGRIDTTSGRSILISETTGGLVDLIGTTVVDDGGGVQLLDNDGDVILDGLTVNNASGIGVEIRGGEGDVTLANSTTITDAAGTGLVVADRVGHTLINSATIEAADGELGVEVGNNDGETWFNAVDIDAANATAIRAREAERFTIASGSVDSDGGAAIDIEDTDVNMVFNSVSASGGAFGIRIVDSEGVFAISSTQAFGSGGLITDTDVGVLLDGFETVGISGLDLTQNGIGLQAVDVAQLALTNVRANDSTSSALSMLDVREFHSINSQYLNNGSLDASIVYEIDQGGSHVFSMTGNTVETSVGDAVRIETLAGGVDATLNASFQQNAIVTHADSVSAVRLNWTGVLLANAISNGIQATGDDSNGYNVTASGPSLVQMSFGDNVMLMDGEQSTAIRVLTTGPSEIVAGGNQIGLNGTGGTAFDFTLAESADVAILRNTIVDAAGGGSGMMFQYVEGPSTIEISDNLLDFQGTSALIDRGIIFESVLDTITLRGDTNNAILNATTPFFAPVGTTQGRVIINGQLLPQ